LVLNESLDAGHVEAVLAETQNDDALSVLVVQVHQTDGTLALHRAVRALEVFAHFFVNT